jgi:hypothetical protein
LLAVNGSVGCSDITIKTPHEFFDHTGMALAPSQYVDRLDIYHAHVMTPAL